MRMYAYSDARSSKFWNIEQQGDKVTVKPGPAQQVEAALTAFREANHPEAKRRAADALEAAAKKLREQPQKKPEKPSKQGGEK
jgi:predicted DNA-binding WGR domain protein